MVFILVNWIITFCICVSIGDFFISRIKSFLGLDFSINEHILFKKFLIGLAMVTFVANACSIFFKINFFFFLGTLLVALLWAVINLRNTLRTIKGYAQKVRNDHPLIWLVILLILILSLFKCSVLSQNADHAGYYLQLAKWIENYKLIPGTALFNGRIGFNSAWHMSSAIFSQSFLFNGGLYDLNGLLYFIFHLVGIRSLTKLVFRKSETSFVSDILLGTSLIFPFSFLIDSIDVDYPTIFIGIFLISECIRRIEQKRFFAFDLDVVCYTVIGLFLFTIRPFSIVYLIPILIIVLYNLKNRGLLKSTAIPLMSFIYVLPWLIRNYYLSGYLIYPIHFVDVFNPEWKLPLEYAKNTFLVIKEFAQIELIRSDYLYTGVGQLGVAEWFTTWLQNTKATMAGCFVIIGLPISIIFGAIVSVRKSISRQFKVLITALFIILVYWFFNFPSVRFAWAFIFSFIILSSTLIITTFSKLNIRHIGKVALVLFLLSLCRTSYLTIGPIDNFKTVWLSPINEMTPINFKENKSGTLRYKVSDTEYCGSLKPPCMPHHNPYKVKLRGLTFEDGFVLDQ